MGPVAKEKDAKPNFLPQRVIWSNVRGWLDVVLKRRHSQDDERHHPRRPDPDRPPRWILDRKHFLHRECDRLPRWRPDQPGYWGKDDFHSLLSDCWSYLGHDRHMPSCLGHPLVQDHLWLPLWSLSIQWESVQRRNLPP